MDTETKRLIRQGALEMCVLMGAASTMWLLSHPAQIVIGHTSSITSHMLAEIMAKAASKSSGLIIECREMESSEHCWRALNEGKIDAYPESVKRLLTMIQYQPSQQEDSAILEHVTNTLSKKYDVTIGQPFDPEAMYISIMRSSWVAKRSIICGAWAALTHNINNESMIALCRRVTIEHEYIGDVAESFLNGNPFFSPNNSETS